MLISAIIPPRAGAVPGKGKAVLSVALTICSLALCFSFAHVLVLFYALALALGCGSSGISGERCFTRANVRAGIPAD